jgi:hypothetical protein
MLQGRGYQRVRAQSRSTTQHEHAHASAVPEPAYCTCCARACASACRDGKVSFDEFLVAFKASGQTVREAGESGLKGEFEFKNAAEML